MNWRRLLRDFGVRFAISFVVLGGLYLLTFGVPGHKKPLTKSQKVAGLRSSLTEVVIIGHEIASYKGSSTLAASDLSTFATQLQTAGSGLEKSISSAPATVTPALKANIRAIGYKSTSAQKLLTDHLTILQHVLAYDPSTDLGGLDITADAEKVRTRADAAAGGLTTALNGPSQAATNQNSGVSTVAALSDDLTAKLNDEISCIKNLKSLLDAKDYVKARDTRHNCIASYPALRKAAIIDVIAPFQGSYDSDLKASVTPLLKQLDTLANY